jgi:3-oxoacyl-[acyl-carrier protein] reductase
MVPTKQNALITGASSGIGAAISEALGLAGYRVFINYSKNKAGAVEIADRLSQTGAEGHAIQADVSKRLDVEHMFESIESDFGFISCLVNNAGITADAPLMLLSDEQWNSVLDINLRGTYLCSQSALRGMIHIGCGTITNIVSPSGIRGQAGQCNYSASKGAVIAFTKALAREMGRYNIRVNAICPGVIETNMSKRLVEKEGKRILAEIPLGRFGRPEEIASVACFLGSEQASYMTGQIIAVDGGLL